MIWLMIGLFALVALAPLGVVLWRPAVARGRRIAAIDLHRAQLAELDRDRDDGRIGAPEHAIATLEVQRRLLAEAALVEGTSRSSMAPLLVLLVLLPVAGVLLYLPGAQPQLAAAPLAARLSEQRRAAAEAASLVARLKDKIATLDPHSDEARQGYMLLGNLEDTSGDLPAAAQAWAQALAIRFEPTLAAQVAEARSRIEGRVSPESAALFRAALAAAPADAPWRGIVEQRLASLSAPVRPALPAP